MKISPTGYMKVRPTGIYVEGTRCNYTKLDSLGVPVSFIDIDMYGSEIDVLKGAGATIIMQRPELLITLHEDRIMKERERIIGLLSNIFDLPIDVKDEGNKLHVWIRDNNKSVSYFRGRRFEYYRYRGTDAKPIMYFDGWTKEVNFRNKFLREGEVVYDLGAHIGSWTIPAALISKKVCAFEPNIDSVSILRDNISLNKLKNVDVVNTALSNGGPVVINSCHNDNNTDLMSKLDDFRLPPPDFIKIDVEGAEVALLEGAQETISRYKPRIFVETHIMGGEIGEDGQVVGGHNTYDSVMDLLPYVTEVDRGSTIYAESTNTEP